MATDSKTIAKSANGDLFENRSPLAVFGPFIVLLLACAFFASQSERFLSGQNFSLILQQVMVVGVIAIGQTLIILTAGIDLSCGRIMALGSIVMAKFAVDLGMNPYLASACGLIVCIVFGSRNGALNVGVFRNGMTLMGVQSVYQILITGILVILAVATDQLSRRKG